MTTFDEIMSALRECSKAEKTELAYQLITEGYADAELIVSELGLTDELCRRKEEAEDEVRGEYPLDVLLWDVPTEELADYVNKTMEEMQ